MKWVLETTFRLGTFALSLVCAACMLKSGFATAQSACADPSECPRDIWMIDTRCISDCECDLSKAKFWRLEGGSHWLPESEESFLKTLDPSKPINFQLPGYWTSEKLAVEHIWKIQHELESQAKCRGLGCANLRVVMWLWPAEKDQLSFIRDLRDKAARAHFEGTLVAKLLRKLPNEMRVNFVAYSYGARVATSAAHELAIGSAESPAPTFRLTGVFIASAVDAEWLEQCQPHQYALGRFERLLIFTNHKDRLLKRYRIVNRDRSSPALGLVGLLLPNAESAANVTQWEVSHIVRRAHNWYRYIESPEIMSAIAEYVLYLHDGPR
jgi:pimeloyl-ACP methyl ester carboxylesterase